MEDQKGTDDCGWFSVPNQCVQGAVASSSGNESEDLSFDNFTRCNSHFWKCADITGDVSGDISCIESVLDNEHNGKKDWERERTCDGESNGGSSCCWEVQAVDLAPAQVTAPAAALLSGTLESQNPSSLHLMCVCETKDSSILRDFSSCQANGHYDNKASNLDKELAFCNGQAEFQVVSSDQGLHLDFVPSDQKHNFAEILPTISATLNAVPVSSGVGCWPGQQQRTLDFSIPTTLCTDAATMNQAQSGGELREIRDFESKSCSNDLPFDKRCTESASDPFKESFGGCVDSNRESRESVAPDSCSKTPSNSFQEKYGGPADAAAAAAEDAIKAHYCEFQVSCSFQTINHKNTIFI